MKIVIFDTETTGLLKPDDAPIEDQPKIIEFYGVAINENFEIIDEVNTYINPMELITPEITRITGIKQDNIDDAPSFGDKSLEIFNLINGSDLLVAHNIAFDNGMLKNEFSRIGVTSPKARNNFCTAELCIQVYGHRVNLGTLYWRMYGKHFKAHRAKNDVTALVAVFHKFIEQGDINLELYKD